MQKVHQMLCGACVHALTCRTPRLHCVYWQVKAGTQFPQNIWQMLGSYPHSNFFADPYNHKGGPNKLIRSSCGVADITWGHSWCFRSMHCRKSSVINEMQDTGRQGVLLLGWKRHHVIEKWTSVMEICAGTDCRGLSIQRLHWQRSQSY